MEGWVHLVNIWSIGQTISSSSITLPWVGRKAEIVIGKCRGRTTNMLDLSGLSGITIVGIFKTITRGMVYEHTSNWNTNNTYSGVSYGGFGFATNSNGNVETLNVNHVQLKGNVYYSGSNATTPDYSKFQHYAVTHNFAASSNETNSTSIFFASLVLSITSLAKTSKCFVKCFEMNCPSCPKPIIPIFILITSDWNRGPGFY